MELKLIIQPTADASIAWRYGEGERVVRAREKERERERERERAGENSSSSSVYFGTPSSLGNIPQTGEVQ